ncbi:MAG: QueT transporter family protein [Clostridia bacterium]|nr:QueT transporter family protein [Clostridia bacterium]
MENKKTLRYMALAAIIAAMYVALTGLSALLGLDKGVIQFRISEALTVLPFICAPAIPGVAIGCFLASLIFGAIPVDFVFGALTTLIAAFITGIIGRKLPEAKWLACFPPIVLNTIVIPFILKYAYHFDGTVMFFMLTVFVGEFVCAGIVGTLLLYGLPKKITEMLQNLDKQ